MNSNRKNNESESEENTFPFVGRVRGFRARLHGVDNVCAAFRADCFDGIHCDFSVSSASSDELVATGAERQHFSNGILALHARIRRAHAGFHTGFPLNSFIRRCEMKYFLFLLPVFLLTGCGAKTPEKLVRSSLEQIKKLDVNLSDRHNRIFSLTVQIIIGRHV